MAQQHDDCSDLAADASAREERLQRQLAATRAQLEHRIAQVAHLQRELAERDAKIGLVDDLGRKAAVYDSLVARRPVRVAVALRRRVRRALGGPARA